MMGEREIGKRGRGEKDGDQEGVEVKRRKEEEREGTEGKRLITFCRVRGGGGRERGREERELGKKRMEEREWRAYVKGRQRE